jgi:hypothetical protein
MATKRLVPNQQFEQAPTTAPYFFVSDATQNYQHVLVSSINNPIIAKIDAVKAEAATAVKDVVYNDHVMTAADITANSFTFRLTPRVPLTSPVEVTVADANGQTGIVVTHTIAGFGPNTTAGVFGAYDVTVTGFADELSVGGTLGILTTWKNAVVATVPN